MTPAPTRHSFFGTPPMASAPLLDSTTFSSNGTPGNGRGLEPVATMTCLPIRLSSAAPAFAPTAVTLIS